ncbi:hypothetical protein MRBLMR1_001117 [Neorhizobium sp. LMR1-1-1.1]
MQAANDNQPVHSRRKSSLRTEKEADIRYELEGDLIEAMDTDQRVLYRKHGIVPDELRSIAARVEAEIAAAIDEMVEEAA